MAILTAALLTAFVLILILLQPSRVIYVRLLSVPVICIAFILCLILLSDAAVKAALNGLKLWAGIVVPSLFPFFVSAEVLNSTGFIRAAGLLLDPLMRPFFNVPGCGSFALAMGVTSGYPVGAKITCDFRANGDMTRTEAERLLAFTNNSGPLFIVGAVGTGMYGSSRLGMLLLVCHFLACISVGFLFRFYKAGEEKTGSRKRNQINRAKKSMAGSGEATRANPFLSFRSKLLERGNSSANPGTVIGNAIKNSVGTILAIGGFIVLFSVIIRLLQETGLIGSIAEVASRLGIDRNISKGILSGIFEITTGSNLVSSASGIPLTLQLPAASLVIGWAGLSVHFQVMSIASATDVSIRPYLVGKLLQGLLSAFYTWLLLNWFHLENLVGEPVLGSTFTPAGWLTCFGSSLLTLSVVLSLFLFLFLAGRHTAGGAVRRKFHR